MYAKPILSRRELFIARLRGSSNLVVQDQIHKVRSLPFHLFPTLCILVNSLFLFLCSTLPTSERLPLGYVCLVAFSVINVFTVGIFGGFNFGVALGQQKDKGSLGLLKLTGIGPAGIVLSSFASAALNLLRLLLIQGPFLCLIFYFGGVSFRQFVAVFSTILATSFLIGSLTMYNAVVTSGSAQGFALTIWRISQGLLFYFLLLGITHLSRTYPDLPLLDTLSIPCEKTSNFLFEFSPHSQLGTCLSPGFNGNVSIPYLAVCAIAGVSLLYLAVRRFELNSSQIELVTPAMRVERIQAESAGKKRPRVSMRCWDDPFLWREFQLISGGWRRILIGTRRVALAFPVLISIAYVSSRFSSEPDQACWKFLCAILTVWLGMYLFIWIIIFGFTGPGCLEREMSLKTLGLLFISGRTPSEIYSRISWAAFVTALAHLPPLILVLAAAAVMARFSSVSLVDTGAPAFAPILIPFFLYLSFLWGLLAARVNLIRSDLLKACFVVLLVVPCIGIGLVGAIGMIVLLDPPSKKLPINPTDYLFPVTLLMLLFCVTTALFIPRLWQSILNGISHRLADD